jgi:AraC-like DNA-binding protein
MPSHSNSNRARSFGGFEEGSARAPETRVERHESESGWWELATRGPHPQLRPHVLGYVGIDCRMDLPRERHLPSAEVELLVNFGAPYRVIDADDPARSSTHRGATVVGVHDRYVVTAETGVQHVLVVRLQPTGAHLLFDLPMHEIANRLVALDDVSSALARRLGDRLYEARTWERRFALMDALLAEQAAGRPALRAAVAWAWQQLRDAGGCLNVGTLSGALGCSRKHLIAQFHHTVGLPPKIVARVLRFNRVLQMVEHTSRIDWAAIAQECGYFDQAHLIRDCRAFAGSTPTELMRRRTGDLFRD